MSDHHDRIDELTLALLSLGIHRSKGRTRARKGFDEDALFRLHDRGLISTPETKNKSVVITDEGVELARRLLQRYLDDDRPTELTWSLLELEVELVDEWNDYAPVQPRIWRRFRLLDSPETTLHDLHEAIQDACGWLDYHLHAFYDDDDGRRSLSTSDIDRGEYEDSPPPASQEIAVRDVLHRIGQTLLYEYDFGDSWYHRITLVERASSTDRVFRQLVSGARAFPPEDAGGVHAYEELVRVAAGGEAEGFDTDALRAWLGSWSPDHFDLKATKSFFDAARPWEVDRKRRERLEQWSGL